MPRGRDGGAAGEEAAYRPPQIVPEAAIAPRRARVRAGRRGRIEAVGGGGEEQRDGKDVHCGDTV
jgi:hypothetical protein